MEWAAYFDERTETMPPAWTRRLEEELLVDQVDPLLRALAVLEAQAGGGGGAPGARARSG